MIITYKKAYPCKAGKHEGGQPGKHAAIPQVPVLQLLQRRLRLPRHRPKESCETPSKGPESTAEDPLFKRSSLVRGHSKLDPWLTSTPPSTTVSKNENPKHAPRHGLRRGQPPQRDTHHCHISHAMQGHKVGRGRTRNKVGWDQGWWSPAQDTRVRGYCVVSCSFTPLCAPKASRS